MVIRLVPVLGKPALAAERTADESPDCRKLEDERSGRGCQGARRRAQGSRRRRPACLRPAGLPTVSPPRTRSEEHTSELQSLMRISYAVFCLKKNTNHKTKTLNTRSQLQMKNT